MKLGWHALALILGLALVGPALAQEDPKKEEPAKEEAPAPPAEAAAAPAAEAKPAAEAAPAAKAAPAAEPAKEMSGCAKSFEPLAGSYKSAYDDMQKWISQIDTETSAAGASVQKVQAQIQANEAATTQAKLGNDSAKIKDLQKENKKLWDELNAAKKGQSNACAKYVKEAPARVKQYADAANKALDALKAGSK